ncbi:S1/P1 Nuclease [Pseudonocardia endophytica]|nr:S1/P1 Nuclease [Pseudonocardia endophytica]
MDSAAEFAGLSLPDLLDARDAYHVHLLRQPNVVATAVGRYLVRTEDEGSDADAPMRLADRLALPPGERPPRTLQNSSVRPWSWPCVLVFVDRWMDADEIHAAPDEMVPRRLYLPDGRMVPTCVVYAPPVPSGATARLPATLSFPSALFGGGYACLAAVQGGQRSGTIACVVTDGLRTYALTNRHVAGRAGQVVTTMVGGDEVRLGVAAGKSVGRLPFEHAYPGLAGRRAEVAVDAGLIEVDDVGRWTTQIFGVGELGPMVDLGPETLSLGMLGEPVRAFGGASGPMTGEVTALYYRYRTRAGVEYLADAVVGPRVGQSTTPTRPGDSGTLWVLDEPAADTGSTDPVPTARPLALQWGGHLFAGADPTPETTPYALVSFLSTACRALDVEPVTSGDGTSELYWGEVGHYTIGALACDLVQPAALKKYFVANRTRISFDLATLAAGGYKTGDADVFHPLADVPDTVWKRRKKGWIRPKESPNHFADMDDPVSDTDPTTLMSMFDKDPATVDPSTWDAFYTEKSVAVNHRGLLPFRVAQLYRIVVDALADGDTPRALAAAGVMAHYVGDACQPLHTSRWHDGRDESEKGVHSDYETAMVSDEQAALATGLEDALKGARPMDTVTGHREAALAVVELMARTIRTLPPEKLLDAWVTTDRDDIRGHSTELWALVGEPTIACIADGCRTLAMLWSSAWKEAGAKAPAAKAVDPDVLEKLYMDPEFAPSVYLPDHVKDW